MGLSHLRSLPLSSPAFYLSRHDRPHCPLTPLSLPLVAPSRFHLSSAASHCPRSSRRPYRISVRFLSPPRPSISRVTTALTALSLPLVAHSHATLGSPTDPMCVCIIH